MEAVKESQYELYKKWPFPVSEEEIRAFGLLQSMAPAQEPATFLSIPGAGLMAMGRSDDAIASYGHASRLDPDSLDHRLALAAARQKTAKGSRPTEAGFDHPEFNPDAPDHPGLQTMKRPTPSPLPGGEHAIEAPLLGGAGGGFMRPMPAPSETSLPLGVLRFPRPSANLGPTLPSPFHPAIPQTRIPNP